MQGHALLYRMFGEPGKFIAKTATTTSTSTQDIIADADIPSGETLFVCGGTIAVMSDNAQVQLDKIGGATTFVEVIDSNAPTTDQVTVDVPPFIVDEAAKGVEANTTIAVSGRVTVTLWGFTRVR